MLTTAPCPLQPSAEPTPAPRPISRQIACMAGFFGDRQQAQATMHSLAALPGIEAGSCMLLKPSDASGFRFMGLARRWAAPWQANRKPPRSPLWRCSGQTLLLLAAAALVWWLQADWTAFDPGQIPMIWMTLLAAAATAAGLLMFGGGWREPRRPRRFDREVRQALVDGRWAVVAHSIDWANQHAAVAALRQDSTGWCAEPATGARL